MSAHGATVDEDVEDRSPESGLLRRFIAGDLAELRVVLALGLIWLIFYLQEPRFLSSVNLSNLVLQMTAVGLVSIGIVLVLLLGEIDLSVGAVSGLCAAIMAVLNVKHGWSPYLAIAAGVFAGTLIGLFQGSVFTRFAVPSFVVTLAGLLAWPGAQLEVLGETGTVNLNDPKILGLTSTFYSDTVGWILALVAIGAYAAIALRARQKRVSEGLVRTTARLGRAADRARGRGGARGSLGPERRPWRPARGADPRRASACCSSTSRLAPRSDATSSPWAETPRRRGGLAST